mmetsp:Transcript_30537/g.55948  ORF Transcript_30537/g.55948 Transcript_30537/m.55948 type:complete len:216 (+) Transcript_30537:306-953(+)
MLLQATLSASIWPRGPAASPVWKGARPPHAPDQWHDALQKPIALLPPHRLAHLDHASSATQPCRRSSQGLHSAGKSRPTRLHQRQDRTRRCPAVPRRAPPAPRASCRCECRPDAAPQERSIPALHPHLPHGHHKHVQRLYAHRHGDQVQRQMHRYRSNHELTSIPAWGYPVQLQETGIGPALTLRSHASPVHQSPLLCQMCWWLSQDWHMPTLCS